MDNIILIIVLLILNIFSLIIGYILGRISYSGVYNNNQQPLGFFNKNNTQNISTSQAGIRIDDSKFIEDISTNHLEKKYQNLGDIKTSDEQIKSSISKLKNMKG